MGFYDPKPSAQDLTNYTGSQEEEIDPTLGQTFGAAFRTQNVVGSFLSSKGFANPYDYEEGFDAIDYVKDDARYSPYADQFAGVFNRKAADDLKMQIDREVKDRRILDSSGTMGVLAELSAGVVDLPSLLPVGGVLASGVKATAGRFALGAALDASVSEGALQATQSSRTGEETAMNIGGSLILGGALGALAGRYLDKEAQSVLSRKIEDQGQKFEEFEGRVFGNNGAQSAGAAARDSGPLELKDEAVIKRLYGVNRQDPMLRLQLSDMDEARGIVRGLAETPLEYKENADGVATEIGGSVETRIKMWHAPLSDTLEGIDTEYARYFNNAPDPTSWQVRLSPMRSEFARKFGKSEKLTYEEFKKEVTKAAFSGEQHALPEVASAAKRYRDIDNRMLQASIDAKLLPEDIAVKGDVSHVFRMYNQEKIIAQRGDFSDILVDHYREAQNAARSRADDFRLSEKIVSAEKQREQFDRAFSRLDDMQRRIDERKDIRGRKNDALTKMRQDRFDVMRERAPESLTRLLRGKDENAAMIATVKQAKADRSAANAKNTYADRFPILSRIKARGGVRVGSSLDAELRAMDIKPKTHPGLFKKDGGLGDVDNWPIEEDDLLANLASDWNGYADRNSLLDAIREESHGRPLQTHHDLVAGENLDALEAVAEGWLEKAGLPANATVKQVRDHINRINGIERNLEGLDSRISRFEKEMEEFDQATDKIINEMKVSEAEAATLREAVEAIETELDEVAQFANSSPRVSMFVDYANAKRTLFKNKLTERTLEKRVEALRRLEKDGQANDDHLADLAAKEVELDKLRSKTASLARKADDLQSKVPRIADVEKAEDFADLSDAELRSLADETINSILGNADGRVPYDSIVSGPRGPLKERLLNISSAKIQDFLELDIEKVMHAQVRTVSADVEIARKFGSVDMSEQIRKINDEADRKIANATDAKERTRLEKSRKAAVRDVEAIRDRLRGQYRLPDNPDGLVLRAGRVIRNLNYLRMLGGMTVSAIPDMGKLVFSHGLISTFRDGFLPLVTNFKAFRLAAEEVKAAGTALDMVLDSRTMSLADITGEFGRHSKFERGLAALSNKFGVVSLMAPWNAAMKQFSGMLTMTNMLNAIERVAAGAPQGRDIANLAASGIDADMAARIRAQFAKHGDKQGGVMLAQAAKWDDPLAVDAFRAAVVREVDKTVVTPGQDKPLWMSTEVGKIIGQFKSFGISSMQKTTLAGLQQRDAKALNGIMVMLALGAVTYKLKSDLTGRDTDDNWRVWAVEAFDKSGLAGWLMDVNNTSEKITAGRVGLSAWTGKPLSRYASRNALASALGPSLGTVQDMLSVIGSAASGEYGASDARKLRQLIPAQNLFYARTLFDRVEAVMGGEPRK